MSLQADLSRSGARYRSFMLPPRNPRPAIFRSFLRPTRPGGGRGGTPPPTFAVSRLFGSGPKLGD